MFSPAGGDGGILKSFVYDFFHRVKGSARKKARGTTPWPFNVIDANSERPGGTIQAAPPDLAGRKASGSFLSVCHTSYFLPGFPVLS